jgi:Flp pilus assembly pilin Flp
MNILGAPMQYIKHGNSLWHKQKGAAMIEYVIVIVFFVIVMFTPFNGGDSVFQLMIAAFKKNYEAFIYALSMPV